MEQITSTNISRLLLIYTSEAAKLFSIPNLSVFASVTSCELTNKAVRRGYRADATAINSWVIWTWRIKSWFPTDATIVLNPPVFRVAFFWVDWAGEAVLFPVFAPELWSPPESFPVQTALFNFPALASSEVVYKVSLLTNVAALSGPVDITSNIFLFFSNYYAPYPFVGDLTPPILACRSIMFIPRSKS